MISLTTFQNLKLSDFSDYYHHMNEFHWGDVNGSADVIYEDITFFKINNRVQVISVSTLTPSDENIINISNKILHRVFSDLSIGTNIKHIGDRFGPIIKVDDGLEPQECCNYYLTSDYLIIIGFVDNKISSATIISNKDIKASLLE